MSNSFLTCQDIAREALPLLANNMVMGSLVHRDYENEIKQKGDTIQVRKPAVFEAKEFDGDLTGEFQGINEGEVSVKLDTILDVSVEVTAKELTLEVPDFNDQVNNPAMIALAEKADQKLCNLAAGVPYVVGTAGTTPDEVADITGCRKSLNNLKCPQGDRKLVIDPDAEDKFLQLAAFSNVDKAGDNKALKDAALGRKFGFDIFMDQNVYSHTKGTLAGTPVTKDASEGDTDIQIDGVTETKSLVAGDIITIAGNNYVVITGDVAGADTILDITIYPALAADSNDEAVTVAANHVKNIAFHKKAFSLVCRPMALPLGGANGYVQRFRDMAIRVTMGYNQTTKKNIISYDMLCGFTVLYPELATVLYG